MPKLLLNLREFSNASEIMLQEDGEPPMKLKRVKAVHVAVDADSDGGMPMVTLTMYSPDFESEVAINDSTAEAVMQHESERQLEFLDPVDVDALKMLAHFIAPVVEHPPMTIEQQGEALCRIERELAKPAMDIARAALEKILIRLARYDEIQF